MFRVRFHGRGGQGIKTASRILGQAFFHEGFEVQDAPVYGAERRGAPMYATVRAARTPILERGLITHPDLVVVADETLVPIPAAGVLLGVEARTVLLVNSAAGPEEWRRRLNLAGPLVTLPVSSTLADQHPYPSPSPVKGEGNVEMLATEDGSHGTNHPHPLPPPEGEERLEITSLNRSELPFIGAMCAGAAARLVGCIRPEALAAALRDELQTLGADIVAANLAHAQAAYAAMTGHAGIVQEGALIAARDYARPDWVEVPFEQARLSAPDIHGAATSVQIKTGAWRTMRPVIDDARCTRCTWVCSTLCPDSAIRVEGGRPVIDYDHCKGCLVCVAVCPPHAIAAVPESEFQDAPSPSLPREGGGGGGERR
jgi:pyruvate ferredoxin oxidoreductase gamma subunit